MDDVYAACAPLVEKTVEVLSRVLRDPARHSGDLDWSELAGIYTVGGAGSFPLVGRMLRKAFGEKRVKRSPHPFAATAIGLAAFLDKGGRLRALRAPLAPFRRLPRGGQWRGRRLRPHPAEGRLSAHRWPAPARRHAEVPGCPQHRTLSFRGVQPPHRRAPRWGRDALRSGLLPVWSGSARRG